MPSETLQKAIHDQPFRPFVIHLADRRQIPVAHPELIAHKPGSRTAVVVDGDAYEFIDLLLVSSLRIEEVARSAGGGGPK